MKIAVNTRLLLKGRMDGIGWFILEHFSRICEAHPEHEFHFLFDRPFDEEFIFSKNVIPHVIGPPARHPFLFKIWYDFSVPRLLKKIGADIFISPDMMCSLNTQVPQIVVLHDLNFEHFPKDLPWLVSNYLRHYTPLFAKKASAVVTVSDFSKRDIVSCYAVPPSHVEVVHNGCNSDFRAFSLEEQQATRLSITAGQPYFVFVSSIHPRKNLQRLLPAFDLFKKSTGSSAKLVVVGRKFWKFPELDTVYDAMLYRDDVIFTGRLEPEMLNRVTSGALASVYISYYEGFGLPILEAFRCGVPVITSSVTAMPEVASEAALFVDPFSIDQIADALCRIWNEPETRQSLIAKGFVRANDFSWDKAAKEFWTVIEKNLPKWPD